MSQLFTKLTEIDGQIDGELKQIDKKIKDLRQERQKLSNLQKALKPKSAKPKKAIKNDNDKSETSKENQ